jgi:hypothetical protein
MNNIEVSEHRNQQSEDDATVATIIGTQPLQGAIVGVLIGFQDEGRTPLVIFPGQLGEAAVPARSTHDVHGAHVGREVVLLFEAADPRYPIIVGCMQRADGWPVSAPTGRVEIDADGQRLIVSAKEQMVLRCGKASITLTKSGKVLIHGTYVSNRSTGVMRIKGGSVQLN